MAAVNYLPLAVVAVVLGFLALARTAPRADRFLSKIALAAFGPYLDFRGDDRDRVLMLQAAYIGTPYRIYAAKTLLYSTIAALAGSVLGVYLAALLLISIPALASGPLVGPSEPLPGIVRALRSISSISPVELFSLLLFSSATVGVVSWVGTYQLRWWIPALRADSRRRRIELSMPRMIAFMYALSRGGLELPRILRILGRHKRVYGEAAMEMSIAGKAIDVFGTDTVSAMRHVSRRTPSDQFRIFTENLASVLQSGRSIPGFFGEQYDQYQEEAEIQQELLLDRLGAVAEGYVALFVVGPLFLITVLLIFGLISGGTQAAMESIIYLLMPLLNLGFIYYLAQATKPLDVTAATLAEDGTVDTPLLAASRSDGRADAPTRTPAVPDGGTAVAPRTRANIERLAAYDRVQAIRTAVENPLGTVQSKPLTILYVAVPLALVWVGSGMALLQAQGTLTLAAADEYVVQGLLIVFVPFAIARYSYTNRILNVERVVPDMFNRLASLNESGIEIVTAFDELRHGELGVLTAELELIWTDITYGMDVERALKRFEDRTRAPSISRAVTLITNGMKASGNIGPVLRIAADESRRLNALKQERENEMSIYLIIIYLSFLVFLAIIFVLVETFIPAIPSQESLETSGLAGAAVGITRAQAATFTMLLFHAALVQATFSGLIAGQMSKGNLRDGAIHVVILVVLAYAVFSVVG